MKILQLAKKFPFPAKDGESIAIMNLAKSLVSCGCTVDLLAMNTTRHHVEVGEVKDKISHFNRVESVEVDNRLRPWAAFTHLIRGKSYHISRFESENYKQKLAELLQNETYDVIQLETLYLAPYLDIIRQHTDAIIAMRAHNVEYEIWEKITHNTTLAPKKWYLQKLTSQLKEYEESHLNDFDFLIAISDDDLRKFKGMGYLNGAISTPVGIPLDSYEPALPTMEMPSKMGFIGSLDWMPNVEGLQWFLDEVMPKLEGIELHVAGRNTPDHLLNMKVKNVKVHGEVRDARAFISEFPIMIVPLLSGSGMRVKILEAMALGKIVITTSKGAEGIGAEHNEQLILADNAQAFATQIHKVLSRPEWSINIAHNARNFIKEKYDSLAIAEDLISAYQEVLSHEFH